MSVHTRPIALFLMALIVALALMGGTAVYAQDATPTGTAADVSPTMDSTVMPTLTLTPTLSSTVTPAAPSATETVTATGTLTPSTAITGAAPVSLVGRYSNILPAADAPGRIVALELGSDMTATMSTQFIGKGAPTVEQGTWQAQGNRARVTFTQRNGQAENVAITWELRGDDLVTVEYDQQQFGTAGLPLKRVSAGVWNDVEFGGVTLAYGSTLATSVQADQVPPTPVSEGPAFGGGQPESTRFTFEADSTPGSADSRPRQIVIYPVDGLRRLDPVISQQIDELQQILTTRPATVPGFIPVFPLVPAQQLFRVQVRYLNLENAQGVSFITAYAQDVAPVTQDQLFYTFQGITNDGKYYISAFWPVSTPALPAAPQSLSGPAYDEFAKNYPNYLNELVTTLDGLLPDGFTPNPLLLNELVQSVKINK